MDIWICLSGLGTKIKSVVLVSGDKQVSFDKLEENLRACDDLDEISAWQRLQIVRQGQTQSGIVRARSDTFPPWNSHYEPVSAHRQTNSVDSGPRSVPRSLNWTKK